MFQAPGGQEKRSGKLDSMTSHGGEYSFYRDIVEFFKKLPNKNNNVKKEDGMKIFLKMDDTWTLFEGDVSAELECRSIIIDESAWIGADACIGDGVCVGADACIGTGVCVGEGARVGKGVWVGKGASVGADACIGAGARIEECARIGTGVYVGEGAWVRKEDE